MKIVVNKCFGGFQLSSEALLHLIKNDSDLIKKMPEDEYTGGRGFNSYEEWKPFKEGFKVGFIEDVFRKDGFVYLTRARDYEYRAHPDLVEVVEKLKDKSHTSLSELDVVEIPDDVDWEIDDYDGIETVHEKHRSW